MATYSDDLHIPNKRYRRQTKPLLRRRLLDRGLDPSLIPALVDVLYDFSRQEDTHELENYTEIERWSRRAVTGTTGVPILVASSEATTYEKQAASVVCEGANDQDAINFAIGLLGAQGGEIRLTTGTFYLSGSIIPVEGLFLRGTKQARSGSLPSTILQSATAALSLINPGTSGIDSVRISDLHGRFTSPSSSSTVIQIHHNCNRWWIERVSGHAGAAGHFVNVSGSAGGGGTQINNLALINCLSQLSEVEAPSNLTSGITAALIQGCKLVAVTGAFTDSIIVGNEISGHLDLKAKSGDAGDEQDNIIVANIISALTGAGSRQFISGNFFNGSTGSSPSYSVAVRDRSSVLGNLFAQDTATDVAVYTYSGDANAVIGNDIIGTGYVAEIQDDATNTRTTPFPAPAPASHTHTEAEITDLDHATPIATHASDADAHHTWPLTEPDIPSAIARDSETILQSLLTTKGDVVARGSSAAERVAVGTDGQVLTADSAASAGVSWDTAGAADELTSLRDAFMFGGV